MLTRNKASPLPPDSLEIRSDERPARRIRPIRRLFLDTMLVLVLGFVFFILAAYFDWFEAAFDWARGFEYGELGDLLLSLPLWIALAAWFVFRRWRELLVGRDQLVSTLDQLSLTQMAIDASPEIVSLVDQDGRIRYVNKQFINTLGYDRDECLSLSLSDIDPSCSEEKWSAQWNNISARRSAVVESRYRRKDGTRLSVERKLTWLKSRGREFIFVAASDITDRIKAAEVLNARLRYEKAIALFSSTFLSSQEDALRRGLVYLLEATQSSRVYVYENAIHPEDGLSMNLSEEVKAEQSPDNTPLLRFSYRHGLNRWRRRLAKGNSVTGLVKKLPAGERDLLAARGVRSVLILPIFVNQRWHGFIGFDDCRSERYWNLEDIRLLRTASEIIGFHIENRRAKDDLIIKNCAIDTSTIGIVLADSAGYITYANPALVEMLGYDEAGTLIGRNLRNLTKSKELVPDMLKACRDPKGWSGEITGLRQDGSTFIADTNASTVRGTRGEPLCLMATFSDITSRKHAENLLQNANEFLKRRVAETDQDMEALAEILEQGISNLQYTESRLRDTEEWFLQLAENIREAFFIRDIERDRTLFVSPAFRTIWGQQSSDPAMTSAIFFRSIYGPDRKKITNAIRSHPVEQPFEGEFRIVRGDGSIRWILGRSVPIRDEGGKVYRLAGVADDITERKESEQRKLDEARSQRDTLVREVHHRIKNHLQGIVGLLLDHAVNDKTAGQALETAISQVNTVAIVHGLQSHASLEQLDLNSLLAGICHATQYLTQTRIDAGPGPESQTPVALAPNEAVPVALILNELVLNAVKHTPANLPDAKVYVRLETKPHCVRVRLTNRGGPLPIDFDISAGKGLGTGLSLVRSLLPEPGAQLTLHSNRDQIHACLELREPLVAAVEATGE